MDTLTQALAAGLLVNEAARRRGIGGGRTILWASAAAVANAPDLDVFAAYWPAGAEWIVHRGATHSLLGGAAAAAFLAGVARSTFLRRIPYRLVVGFYFLAILSHLLLDFLTPYRVQFFWPVDYWPRLNLTGGIDVVTFAVFLSLAVGLRWKPDARKRAWVVALGALAANYAFWFACKQAALSHLRDPSALEVTVRPDSISPLIWRGALHYPDHYALRRFSLLGGPNLTARLPLQDPDDPILRASRQGVLYRRFARRTRFPYAFVESSGKGTRVLWVDLEGRRPDRLRAEGRLVVELDRQGRIVRERLRTFLERLISR
ncbi:MAG: metal-dependent hydrolase [Acidobacteria bacterium]|nr:metal-dependent hydrolase [Acidobacteriota bacterium]